MRQKRTSSGHGTAPLRCRLSDTTRPSFRTSCSRRTLVMSSSGLAATTIRSDQDGSIRLYLGLDAVDQVRMRKDCLHDGLLGLKSENTRLDRDTEAQIGLAGKQGVVAV